MPLADHHLMDAANQLHRDRHLVGQVQLLELLEKFVDLLDLPSASRPRLAVSRPMSFELMDLQAGFLQHPEAPPPVRLQPLCGVIL